MAHVERVAGRGRAQPGAAGCDAGRSIAAVLAGCSLFATPRTDARSGDPSLAPTGPVGYVVCPNAVTPVELTTDTAEAAIPLPISGTPVLGDFAIATSPDGHWAYVVTSDGVIAPPSGSSTTRATPATPRISHDDRPPRPRPGGSEPVQNVVIPIDLVTQRAEAADRHPGGGRHPRHRRHAQRPDGSGRQRDLHRPRRRSHPPAWAPHSTWGRVAPSSAWPSTPSARPCSSWCPERWSRWTPPTPPPVRPSPPVCRSRRSTRPTASLSPTTEPLSTSWARVGRTSEGASFPSPLPPGWPVTATGFDRFGISDPAAVAVTSDGATASGGRCRQQLGQPHPGGHLLEPVDPGPAASVELRLHATGTGHPTDIVLGPDQTGAFIVDGFDAVIPYSPASQTFGDPIPVCSGASSMAVAAAP